MDAADLFSQHPELKNLRRALQLCKGFGLYFVSCNTILLRQTLVAAIKTHLAKPILELPLVPKNDIYIDVQMSYLLADASDEAIVFIYDLEKLHHLKDRHVLQELNWRREYFGRINHPVVFWLPDFLVTEIFREAPDFADWRSGVYEFSLQEADKLSLMTSTWESVNENFVGNLMLEEKQRWIVNLENLLQELQEQAPTRTKADLYGRLSQLYKSLGNFHKAFLIGQEFLKLSQEIGDKQCQGIALNLLATIAHAQGDENMALEFLKDSLALCNEIGDRNGEGATLNNISQILMSIGKYDDAIQLLNHSLQIRQELGDPKGGVATLNNISLFYQAKGDYELALNPLIQSLQVCQDIGDLEGEGVVMNNISQIYTAKKDYDTALNYLEKSLKIREEIGDKQGIATTVHNISQIFQVKGDYGTAFQYLEKALSIQQEIGDKKGEGVTLNSFAVFSYEQSDFDASIQYLEKAIRISLETDDKESQCVTFFNLGFSHLQKREFIPAVSCWLESYDVAKQIGWAKGLESLNQLAKNLGHEGLSWWETLSQAEENPQNFK